MWTKGGGTELVPAPTLGVENLVVTLAAVSVTQCCSQVEWKGSKRENHQEAETTIIANCYGSNLLRKEIQLIIRLLTIQAQTLFQQSHRFVEIFIIENRLIF